MPPPPIKWSIQSMPTPPVGTLAAHFVCSTPPTPLSNPGNNARSFGAHMDAVIDPASNVHVHDGRCVSQTPGPISHARYLHTWRRWKHLAESLSKTSRSHPSSWLSSESSIEKPPQGGVTYTVVCWWSFSEASFSLEELYIPHQKPDLEKKSWKTCSPTDNAMS